MTVLAYDRNALLAGSTNFRDRARGSKTRTSTASCRQRSTALRPPPAGQGESAPPDVLMGIGHPDLDGSQTSRIHIYSFHPDFQNSGGTTFTGPFDLEVEPFDPIVNARFGTNFSDCSCLHIPQPQSSGLIFATGTPEFRLTYRNFGDHESIVLEHDVYTDGIHTGPRWYEIRDPFGSPFVYQQGTYGPGRWTMALDGLGGDGREQQHRHRLQRRRTTRTPTPGSVMPAVSRTIRSASWRRARRSSWPATTLRQRSEQLKAGAITARSSVDPSTSCTFWYTTEYTPASAGGDYSTRIGSFKFPELHGRAARHPRRHRDRRRQSASGVMVTAGASTGFTDVSGHYSFTLPAGTYDMTVSKYGYSSAAWHPASPSRTAVTRSRTSIWLLPRPFSSTALSRMARAELAALRQSRRDRSRRGELHDLHRSGDGLLRLQARRRAHATISR